MERERVGCGGGGGCSERERERESERGWARMIERLVSRKREERLGKQRLSKKRCETVEGCEGERRGELKINSQPSFHSNNA